jgi:hypothetical protein
MSNIGPFARGNARTPLPVAILMPAVCGAGADWALTATGPETARINATTSDVSRFLVRRTNAVSFTFCLRKGVASTKDGNAAELKAGRSLLPESALRADYRNRE